MKIKMIIKAMVVVVATIVSVGASGVSADNIIRIASPFNATQLDPALSASAGNIEAFGQLYSRVFRRGADGSLQPALAKSWDVSADGKTITLHLGDYKFSDGSPITADDVVFSLLRTRDHKKGAYAVTMKQLNTATAKDAHTVVLTLKNTSATFIGNLEVFNAGIISKKDVATRGEEAAFATVPVSSGPYMVKEWKHGDRLILQPNPNYWRTGYPKNDGAELIEISDADTRISSLLANEIDATRIIPWSQVNTLKENSKISVPLNPSTVIFMSLLNHTKGAFSNIKVRQAASMALNKVAIAKAVTFGYAKPANTTLPLLDFHHDNLDVNGYNPSKAKALLAEAGAPSEPVVILIRAAAQDEQLATIIQAQWAAIGLKSKIEKVDRAQWWPRVTKFNYDAAPSWWYNETTDPDLAVGWALCGTCGSKSFYTGYVNAEVDKLMEQGAAELDASKREVIYHKIQEIATSEVSQIPLYYPPYANAYSARVKGLYMTPALQWTLEDTVVK